MSDVENMGFGRDFRAGLGCERFGWDLKGLGGKGLEKVRGWISSFFKGQHLDSH